MPCRQTVADSITKHCEEIEKNFIDIIQRYLFYKDIPRLPIVSFGIDMWCNNSKHRYIYLLSFLSILSFLSNIFIKYK